MIEISVNKTMFGKTCREFPYKAELLGNSLAVGETKRKCAENAQAKLEEGYRAGLCTMSLRRATDGTVFIGRWTGEQQIEYAIYHPDSDMPCYTLAVCRGTLYAYMDDVVAQYNAICQSVVKPLPRTEVVA